MRTYFMHKLNNFKYSKKNLLRFLCIFDVKAFLLFGLLFANFANSQNNSWPHIRGPEYNGHANGPSINFSSQQQFPLIWKTKIGQGYSGCVIVDGKVFTQAQNRSGQHVICLDAETGKELWRTRYGWPWELNGQYPGTYSTPTWSEGKIYFTGCYGEAGCLDAETGAEIWIQDLSKKFNVEIPSFGYACTPLLEGGKIYLTLGKEGGSIFSLDAKDGSLVWKSGKHPASYSSPIVIDVAGNKQIISFLENVLLANDPETGRELWQIEISQGYDEHSAWPVYEPPFLFCASPFYRNAQMLEVRYKDDHPIVTQKWQSKVMSNDIFSSVIVDGYIYGFHIKDAQANPAGRTKGSFKCIELKTGKEMWGTQATGHVNVIAYGGKLVLFSDNGSLIIAEANSGKYSEITRQKIFKEVNCWTLPALWNGKLFLHGGHEIVCLDLQKTLKSNGNNPDFESSKSFSETVDNWLHQYKDDAFIAPTFKHMWLWFLFSISILVFAAIIAFLFVSYVKHSWILFLILSSIIGLVAPLILSPLVKEFIFTWPVCLFVVFLSVLQIRAVAIRENTPIKPYMARIMLVIFILICLGYYELCHLLFIISGIGFLVGLIPLTPLVLWIVRHTKAQIKILPLIATLLAFVIYFWLSAIFIIYRT